MRSGYPNLWYGYIIHRVFPTSGLDFSAPMVRVFLNWDCKSLEYSNLQSEFLYLFGLNIPHCGLDIPHSGRNIPTYSLAALAIPTYDLEVLTLWWVPPTQSLALSRNARVSELGLTFDRCYIV